MYPSFRRNQQPYFKGNSFRSEGKSFNGYDEIDYARNQVLDSCRRAGAMFAHWRRYTPEFNNGQCDSSYHGNLNESADPQCPVCYGTGFENGYSNPSAQFMIIQTDEQIVQLTTQGFLRMRTASCTSPYLPNMSTGDMIGEIKNMEGEWVVDDRFLVEGDVDKKRFRTSQEFFQSDTYDHLDPEKEVFGYKFRVQRIQKHSDPDKRNVKYSVPFENIVWLTDPSARY